MLPDDFDPALYNKIASHPLQSWQWGEARKKMGIRIVRLGEYDDDSLRNVYQLTLHPIPYTPFTVGYVPRSRFPTQKLLDFLHEYGKKMNIIFIKLEPYQEKIDGNELCVVSSAQNPKHITQNILTPSPHPLFPNWTIVLDITRSENDLLKTMKPKTRYNIRLAQKKGVVLKEMSNEEGFEVFKTLYFDTCKRQNYRGHNQEYHEIVWNALKEDIAHILIAFYEDKPLAAYELFHFKETLYYPYGGTSLEFKQVMAPNLLMWEAILLGKKLGAKTFDMWGALPPFYEGSQSWSGFTRFKEGYGGKFVEMVGSYDLIINQLAYSAYGIINKIRSKVL